MQLKIISSVMSHFTTLTFLSSDVRQIFVDTMSINEEELKILSKTWSFSEVNDDLKTISCSLGSTNNKFQTRNDFLLAVVQLKKFFLKAQKIKYSCFEIESLSVWLPFFSKGKIASWFDETLQNSESYRHLHLLEITSAFEHAMGNVSALFV